MPKYFGDVRYWVNSGKLLLALSFSGFDPISDIGVWGRLAAFSHSPPRRKVVGFRNCTSGRHMLRRKFITLFGGAAAIWPLAASAQQPTVPVIGFLSGATFETMREYVVAFHRGLADAGFVEGRNLAVEYRWAEGHNDRLPALATDLVRRGVAIIVVGASTPGALAAKAVTQTIPIFFYRYRPSQSWPRR